MRGGKPAEATWRLGRRPALDGVRGIAIALVMVGHAIPAAAEAGGVGVVVFFTLSGFLITSLLLEERSRTGRISLSAFYARRARRLMPALWVTVTLATLTAWWAFRGPFDPSLYIGALTYTSNFMMADGTIPNTPLGHTWSLAIEEQFYVVWPLLLILTARLPRRWLLGLLGYGAFFSLLLRNHFWRTMEHPWARDYFGTDTRADALLIGCALAVFMTGRVERQHSLVWPVVGVSMFVALIPSTYYLSTVLLPTIVALSTALVLWGSAQGAAAPWLTWRPLVLLGQRSYGLYLLQSVVGGVAVMLLGDSAWVKVFVMLPISWGAALLSWRYVEQPFLRRRCPRAVSIALELAQDEPQCRPSAAP